MGLGSLFDASSNSTASDNRIAATDQALVSAGHHNKVIQTGAADLTNAHIQTGGISGITAGKGATVTINEGGGSDQLASILSALLPAQGATAPPGTANSGSSGTPLPSTSDTTGATANDGSTTDTGTTTTTTSNWPIWALLGAAALALFFITD